MIRISNKRLKPHTNLNSRIVQENHSFKEIKKSIACPLNSACTYSQHYVMLMICFFFLLDFLSDQTQKTGLLP